MKKNFNEITTIYPFQVDIIESKRKTIEIQIISANCIQVRKPKHVSQKRIKEMIAQKRGWIDKHLQAQSHKENIHNKAEQGGEIQYLGQTYKIEICQAKRNILKIDETSKSMVISVTEDEVVNKLIRQYYTEVIRRLIKEKIELFGPMMGVFPESFRIKAQRTLWGSCSSKGNLNFNWKIGFAPLEVVDYLIIHELAHLKHMNHQKEFWEFVEIYSPEYKVHRTWLKTNGSLLKLYN